MMQQYNEAHPLRLTGWPDMPGTARRTATYDASVLEAAERVRTSPAYRQALVDLTGHEPRTASALFNDLARIALEVIERRALEIGYRQLAVGDAQDDVDEFLEAEALAGFDYADDEDAAPLLDVLSRGGR
jgi:hypothetical protein